MSLPEEIREEGDARDAYEGARRLAVGMLEGALRDIAGRKTGSPAEALAWLASPRAYLWFDLLDLDPEAFMDRVRARLQQDDFQAP